MRADDAAASRYDREAPNIIDRRSPCSTLVDSLVLVDKSTGCTSFDVVRKLRRLSGVRKIGHAGTLDPMASGLLICMVGRATKSMSTLVDLDKEYTGTIRLGAWTPSYDAETPVTDSMDASHITIDDVYAAASESTGTIIQTTPPYSAVKVGGERLYKKARRGDSFTPPPRVVSIYEFRIDGLSDGDVQFYVRCSKGTYVRSIAHELGQSLGVGGHLVRLRRTAVGPYRVDEALTVDELATLASSAPQPPTGT